MYLKEIYAYGFKSFAKPTRIKFDRGVTGIIGPNGSGKSNINDAIRWVLGETSKKDLRSSEANDFIFGGSESMEPLYMAEVSIKFDNEDHLLKTDYNEVEITRRKFKDTGENEYYINKNRVRLRDVQELIMDTGIGKGTLAIISQGTVNKFIESKPEDRRLLFEEAAGISKYRKKKLETLSNLEKANENLNRVIDIKEELEKRVPKLKKQAENAKKYLTFKKELDEIEIIYLSNKLKILTDENNSFVSELKKIELENIDIKNKFASKQTKNTKINNDLLDVNNKISDFEKDKINLESEIQTINEIQKSKLNIKNDGKSKLTKSQEIANAKNICLELEINLEQLQNEINTNSEKKNELEIKINKISSKYAEYNLEKTETEKSLYKIESEINSLKAILKNNSNISAGVETILKHKKTLKGVIDTVENLISIDKEYVTALSEAAGRTLSNIVVDDYNAAKMGVEFLKKNHAGWVTFMPLKNIKNNFLSEQQLEVLNSQTGFINSLANLITIEEKYQVIINNLFGLILICNTLDNAIKIANFVDKAFKIVTLEGDIIFPGGALSGGYKRNFFKNKLLIENQIEELDKKYSNLKEQLDGKTDLNNEDLTTLNNQLLNLKSLLYKLESNYTAKKERYTFYKLQYEQLSNKKFENEDNKNNIINDLSQANVKLIKINNDLKILFEEQKSLNSLSTSILHEINDLNDKNNQQVEKINNIESKIGVNKFKINNFIERLNKHYQITEEYALKNYLKEIDINETEKKVEFLKKEIESIGTINELAIDEYEHDSKRLEGYKKNYEEIKNSQDQLLEAIDKMDNIVITKLSDLIANVNQNLPETFKKLFGGGSAEVIYNNEDNLLETGIDITVQPPGKKIGNLNLLSGGEKSLVALSVLFAILKSNPVPLSVLDEAEAPLDVANVERFANYLHSFTNKTQFIVITHRPGTMEKCDTLYGVTMQEQGVTNLVNIKINEISKYIDEENKKEIQK